MDDRPPAQGEILAAFHPRGVLWRGAVLRILGPVDLNLLVFTYPLVNARWQEQAAAASAVVAGAS